jgi:hypothetical protein
MKNTRLVLLVTYCAVVLSSCTQVFVFKLFNNTGSDIVVISYDNQMASKTYSVKVGESANIQYPTRLSIRSSNAQWQYKEIPYVKTYVYVQNGWRFQNIQVENTGIIRILPPGVERAMVTPPPQPTGFPLLP